MSVCGRGGSLAVEMMDICLLKHVDVLGFLSVVVHLSKQHNVRDPEFGENKRSGCTYMTCTHEWRIERNLHRQFFSRQWREWCACR